MGRVFMHALHRPSLRVVGPVFVLQRFRVSAVTPENVDVFRVLYLDMALDSLGVYNTPWKRCKYLANRMMRCVSNPYRLRTVRLVRIPRLILEPIRNRIPLMVSLCGGWFGLVCFRRSRTQTRANSLLDAFLPFGPPTDVV